MVESRCDVAAASSVKCLPLLGLDRLTRVCLGKIQGLTPRYPTSNTITIHSISSHAMTNPPALSISHAYRALYRSALSATLHSMPARLTIRKRMRDAFRKQPPQALDQERIARTLLFLRSAAEAPGLERQVVRNLVRVWGERDRNLSRQDRNRVLRDNVEFQEKAWEGFEECVRGLERSLGVGFG